MKVKALPHAIRDKNKEEKEGNDEHEEEESRECKEKTSMTNNKLAKQQFQRFFLCCQLPGGKPRQTPLWKRSNGTIWLEEEYVHCSAQLRIIYHNGSTWCSERGLAERELEHHKRSISANKAGENSNISLSISGRSPSHRSLPWYQLFLPSPPLSTCLHLLMLICCFSDTHHWGSHF